MSSEYIHRGWSDAMEISQFWPVVEYFQAFSKHSRLSDLVTIPIGELHSIQCGKHLKNVFADCIATRGERLKYVLLAIPYDTKDSVSLLELVTGMVNSAALSTYGKRVLYTLVVELHDVMVCALPPKGDVEDRKIVQAFRRARDVFVGWCEPFPRDCEAPTSGFPYYPEW